MISSRSSARLAKVLLLPILLAALTVSCCGGKEGAPASRKGSTPDLAGSWQSDLEAADRTIARSSYLIEQAKDSARIHLTSTLSPAGNELVPEAMTFEARGEWRGDALRLRATYWISGKDTCAFELMGKMDPEGRLLLFFPADICGDKSLPYTRKLHRAE